MAGFKNGAVAIKKKDIGVNADPNFINILVDTSNNLYTVDEFGVYRSIAGYDIVSSGSDISLVTSGGTKIISLSATGVVSGVYGDSVSVPQILVDNKGRILSAYNIPISASGLGTVTSVSISSTTLKVINSPITTFGTFGINLSATGVTSGSILKPFVDSYGRVLSGGLISAVDISDRSTDTSLSGNSDNKIPTEKAIKTYVDTTRLYVSTGISLATPPNFVNNNDGTITIEPTTCRLYSTTDFTGNILEYDVAGTTLALTDGIEQHVCIKYNSGTPIYYVENSDENINDSDVVCVYIVWRQGLEIHSLGMDSLGLGLGNKTLHAINNTTPYKKSYLGGLVVSETVTPNPRTVLITSGNVYAGVVEQLVFPFNSSIDRLTLAYHNSGNWTYSDNLVYNNTQYDNGTNLVTIGNNKFSVRWFYRSVGDIKQTFYVLGSGEYNNISDARLELPRTDLPTLLLRHCVLVGRALVEYNASNGITEPISDISFSQAIVQNHNDLRNIQGGSVGEYYHLTSTQSSFLSSGPFLPLSGGTLSGPVTLPDMSQSLYYAFSAGGDGVRFVNNGVGRAFRITNNSTGNGMLIANYSTGTSLSIQNSLSGSGAAISTNSNIIASAFNKSGGTSTQFLKADGSVDSNTYATISFVGNYLPLSGGTLTGQLNGVNSSFSGAVDGGNSRMQTGAVGAGLAWFGYAGKNGAGAYIGYYATSAGGLRIASQTTQKVSVGTGANYDSLVVEDSGISVNGNISATQQIQTLSTFRSRLAGNYASVILNSNGAWLGIGSDGSTNNTLKIGATNGDQNWTGNANLTLGGTVSAGNIYNLGNYYVSNYSGGGTPALITNTGNARFYTLSLIDYNSTTGGGSLLFTDANIGATGGSFFANSGKQNAIQLKGSGDPGFGGLYFGQNNTEYIGVKGSGYLYLGSSTKVQIDTNQIQFSSTGSSTYNSTYDISISSTNGNVSLVAGTNLNTTSIYSTTIAANSQLSLTAHSSLNILCDSDVYINSTSGIIYTQATQNAKNIHNDMISVTATTAATTAANIYNLPDGYNLYYLTQGTTSAYRNYRLPTPTSPKKIVLICGDSASGNLLCTIIRPSGRILYNSAGSSILSFQRGGAIPLYYDGTDWYCAVTV